MQAFAPGGQRIVLRHWDHSKCFPINTSCSSWKMGISPITVSTKVRLLAQTGQSRRKDPAASRNWTYPPFLPGLLCAIVGDPRRGGAPPKCALP
jgi:hypothetical protein